MNYKIEEIENRRDFLKKCTRTFVLGGFVFMGGFLGLRRSKADGTSTCILNLPCRDCTTLPCCQEPRALPFKQREGTEQGLNNEKE